MQDMSKEFAFQNDYPSYESGFIYKKQPQVYELAKFLINEMGFVSVGDYAWLYDKTHYKILHPKKIDKLIIELTNEDAKPSWIRQYREILIAKAQSDNDSFKQPELMLNLANGVLDLEKARLYKHDKCYNFRYCVPIKYDPEADCPVFMKYLDDTFEGDNDLKVLTSQIYGYCLMGGDPFLHKSFVLYGSGRNGKSVWQHALKGLLGKQNYSSVSMSKLDKAFSVYQLDGKLANIVGELTNKAVGSEEFKTAVGGEELLASAKFKDEYSLKINARLVFACNHLPKFGDTSSGLREKLCIIPFNRYLMPHERDNEIFNKISGELSGILNFALAGCRSVLKHRKLIESAAVSRMIEEYEEETDSVGTWIKRFIKEDEKETKSICMHDLYLAYAEDMSNEYKNLVSEQGFKRRFWQDPFVKRSVIKKGRNRHGRYAARILYFGRKNLFKPIGLE